LYLETQNPRALGPTAEPKRLGSRPRTQEHCVQKQNPRSIGFVFGAPKRLLLIFGPYMLEIVYTSFELNVGV